MTSKRKTSKPAGAPGTDPLTVKPQPGMSEVRQLAGITLDPATNAMAATRLFNKGTFGDQDTTQLFVALAELGKAAKAGDLSHQRALLAAQADTLNAIFTEMARRAAINMGDYLGATETYLRLGLKAQSQCRATIEALERLSGGRVQTVRHVHVSEGGQAIVAETFHHHAGGHENGQADEQPHATGAAGAGPALPGPDPIGPAVPIPGSEGQGALPDARRQGQRGT